MKLYEIANEYQALIDDLNEVGELSQEEKAKLDEIKATAEDKIKNVAYVIKTLQHEREIIKEEAQRLAKKASAYEARIDYLRKYLGNEMNRLDLDQVKNVPYFNINLRPGRFKVNPDNLVLESIPDEYKITETKIHLDKKKMVEEMQAGVVIPGAELVRDFYVEIR